jgi:hypothetical protein
VSKAPITRLTFDKRYTFADEESARDFYNKKRSFIDKHKDRDHSYNITEDFIIDGVASGTMLACEDEAARPQWMNESSFILSTLLCCGACFHMLFAARSLELKCNYIKRLYSHPRPAPEDDVLAPSSAQVPSHIYVVRPRGGHNCGVTLAAMKMMQAHYPTFAFTVSELTGQKIAITTLGTLHTVADLLHAVTAATGGEGLDVAAMQRRLIYKNVPLDDESRTLGSCGIEEGSEVVAVANGQDAADEEGTPARQPELEPDDLEQPSI